MRSEALVAGEITEIYIYLYIKISSVLTIDHTYKHTLTYIYIFDIKH